MVVAFKRWRNRKLMSVIYLFLFFVMLLPLTNVRYLIRERTNWDGSIQSNARIQLKKVYDQQRSHLLKKGKYAKNFEELGFNPNNDSVFFYNYFLNKKNIEGIKIYIPNDGFIAFAIYKNKSRPQTDIWMVDHNNRLFNIYDMDINKTYNPSKIINPNDILKMPDEEYFKFKKRVDWKKIRPLIIILFMIFLGVLFYISTV